MATKGHELVSTGEELFEIRRNKTSSSRSSQPTLPSLQIVCLELISDLYFMMTRFFTGDCQTLLTIRVCSQSYHHFLLDTKSMYIDQTQMGEP